MQEIARLQLARVFSKADTAMYPRTLALLDAAEHAYLRCGRRAFVHEGRTYRIATSNAGRLVVQDGISGDDLVSSFPPGMS